MFSLFSFGFFPSTFSTTVEVHLSSLTVIFFQLHSREATQETPAQLPNFTTSGIANRQATFSFCLFNDPSVPQWQRLRTKRGRWQVRPVTIQSSACIYIRLPTPDRTLTHNQLCKSLHSCVCAPMYNVSEKTVFSFPFYLQDWFQL